MSGYSHFPRATAAQAKDTTNSSVILTPSNQIDVGVFRELWRGTAIDMNSTADQAVTKVGSFTNYFIFFIRIIANAAATSAVGGVYDGASKTGNIIVAASQVHTGLTGAAAGANITVAVTTGQKILSAAPIVSLSTPHGSAATADWYFYGVPLS